MRTAKSSARWRGFKGVNVSGALFFLPTTSDPIGFSSTVYQGRAAAAYPPSTCAALLAMGFDHLRVITNPVPMLQAQSLGLTSLVASLAADVVAECAYFVAQGLAVNLDVACSPSQTTWGPPYLLADPRVSAPKIQALFAVDLALAKALVGQPPEMIALELLNEPTIEAIVPGINAAWNGTILPALWSAIRAVDAKRTLIVSPSDFNAIDSLVGSAINPQTTLSTPLTASNFDANTVYDFHAYLPPTIGNCGYGAPGNANQNTYWLSGLTWPLETAYGVYDAAALAAAISQMTSNVNGDTSLSSSQQSTLITALTNTLTGMYQNQGRNYLVSTETGQLIGGVPVRGALEYPSVWARMNGVDESQILHGEYGVCMAYSGSVCTSVNPRGASQAGRDALLAEARKHAEGKGRRHSAFELDSPFGFGLTLGNDPTAIPASTKAALGLN